MNALELTRFRFCPSCAAATLICHMDNGMQCTTCGCIYFHNTASAAAAIIEYNDTILITTRAHEPRSGMYDLPGGFVAYGETVEDACVREVREELGITVSVNRYLGSYANRYEYRGVSYFTTDTVLVCGMSQGECTVTPNSEIAHWEFVAPDMILPEKLAFESNRRALQDYIKCK